MSVVGSMTEVEPVIDALVGAFGKIHRNIDFDAEVEEGLRFRGDRRDLDEMVGNLVDNAGKWARTSVEIRAARLPSPGAEAVLVVTVDDDGPGLAPEQRIAALARGQRLDETKPGSGLGLSIVADLASVHGGGLALEESPTGGLRASLRLPAG